MKKIKEIYLDNASNTPLDKRVFRAMKPFMSEKFVGNTHSIHFHGIEARTAIENARKTIADIAGVAPSEVYFTSGATESNNWVLKSLAYHELYEEKRPKKHLVVSAIEHASILSTCKQLEKMGFSITYLKPNKDGKITPLDLERSIRHDTLLVCVMAVNNETGVSNPVNLLGEIAHKHKALMMSDCTQMLTYGDGFCRLKKIMPNVDYFTFSGHKIYGPTGTGCLIVSKSAPIYPLLSGGGQEFGVRGGTSNTSGIVGLGEAYKLISQKSYAKFFYNLAVELVHQLGRNNILFRFNCNPDHENIISINFKGYLNDSELASSLVPYGIACSAGSACEADSGGSTQAALSHVLTAMGISEEVIHNTVRVSFSKYTTKKDIKAFVKAILKLKKLQGGC
jgi:cysteine desulfurase